MIFVSEQQVNYCFQITVQTKDDEHFFKKAASIKQIGINFFWTTNYHFRLLAKKKISKFSNMIPLIAGFQCHAIQNRSKQKSKPFNR